ncbi:PaaI family thioesterase [Microtetraspora sp. AC03309]|uniref:PaaI family thioesterase n=1 Tax=Microtetraspora sp. AC03309 TaxID=2779376 RepID=UPI001E5B9E34|nr:PaaI family thioesterase [Microtetraspora sp. AC03309]MCC5576339.1 PaaI family thioesterase [Microtetraspora sp. AC03309]
MTERFEPDHGTVLADVTPERRRASIDLITAIREVMLAAAVTDLDVDEMRAAERALTEVARTLGKRTRTRVVRAPFGGPAAALAAGRGGSWPLFAHNPLGIPLEIHLDGDSAMARLTPNALHEGPPDLLHGGFGAGLMDCMLGVLMQARGKRSVTASLELRFLHGTPLDRPLELRSRIVEVSGRKAVAEGWIECEGRRTLEARGLFIEVRRDGA